MSLTQLLEERIREGLKPESLHVKNVSAEHHGHVGVEGDESGETHFNVMIISDVFVGKNRVKRHQMVYAALGDLFQNSSLHALQIDAKTPEEA